MTDYTAFARAMEARGDGGRLVHDEPMSRHTSFGIGGPADLLLVAQGIDELVAWVGLARAHGVPLTVLGQGTNVLVADAGVRGLVIVNACRGYRVDAAGVLTVEAGALLREVARRTVAENWRGLEWAVGIPGTVGGAVVGNAGAYGGSMSDVVRWVRLLRPDGAVEQMPAGVLDYGYRLSALKREPREGPRTVVLEAGLQLASGDAEELAAIVARITAQRKERTPEGCCAGSIFKRTMQYPAGFLIEQAGLKGHRVGGAEVSPKHANFVMNTGNATAADVRTLIELIQREVWAALGQRLEPEIEYLGAWPAEGVTTLAQTQRGETGDG